MDKAHLYSDSVTQRALEWLELKLSDEDDLGDLWGNYIEGGLEVHPSREEIDALVPKVKNALMHALPLPDMDADVKYAFSGYLAGYDGQVLASECVNSDEENENWANEVQDVYIALRSPLLPPTSL